jgi:periplasmic mercuric ion binding protein
MRSPIYLFAALAAAGIAYYLASSPAPTTTPAATNATAEVTPARQVLTDSGTLTMRVEDMHCEYGCFPTVKKTLEGFDQVVSVELDEQAEEGSLDNPQVLVTYEPGFDLTAAQSALAKNGFAKSSVVP